jgi:plasmid stabilization system protein ParE
MREVVWTRGAEADLQAAYEQLEAFQEGMGDGFLSLIDAAIELLRQFPEMAPIFQAPFRRLVIKDGVHGLFYTVEDRGIILHALADLRRSPDELRRRFRKVTEQ